MNTSLRPSKRENRSRNEDWKAHVVGISYLIPYVTFIGVERAFQGCGPIEGLLPLDDARGSTREAVLFKTTAGAKHARDQLAKGAVRVRGRPVQQDSMTAADLQSIAGDIKEILTGVESVSECDEDDGQKYPSHGFNIDACAWMGEAWDIPRLAPSP